MSRRGRGVRKGRMSKKIHFFKRTSTQVFTITDTWQTLNWNTNFQLSGYQGYTEFTNLFDQYKICGMKLKFEFDRNQATATSGATSLIPNLITVNDWTSGGAATGILSENAAVQYESFKVSRLDRPTKRYVRPKYLQDISAAAAFGTVIAGSQGGAWIDTPDETSVGNVQYYGLLGAVDGSMAGGSGTNTLGQLKVYFTAYIACRDVY